MPVHLYGQCADMDAHSSRLPHQDDLVIIEDAAQAIGAEYRGRRTGTLGGLACFSFYPSKNLGTYGDAGMVTTDDPAWAERMKVLRVHGMEPKYYHKYLAGMPGSMRIQAAILRVKLPYLESWTVRSPRGGGSLRRSDRIEPLEPLHATPRGNGRSPACVQSIRRASAHFGPRPVAPAPEAKWRLRRNLLSRTASFAGMLAASRLSAGRFSGQRGGLPIGACALPMFPEITPQQQQRVVDVCAAIAHNSRASPRKASDATPESDGFG